MNPIQLLASFLKFQRTVRTISSQIFFLRSFEYFSSSLELMWFCLDNFESIELQNLAKPLHICVVVISWSSLRNLVVRYLHIAQTIGKSNSIRPIAKIYPAWRSRKFRVSCIRKWVNILCFAPAMLEVGFAGGWRREEDVLAVVFPRKLEKHLSNLTISLSILPWVFDAVLANPFPLRAHGRPQLVSASNHPEVVSGDRLIARHGQPNECSCRCFSFDVISHSWWDVMADLDATQTKNHSPRTMFQRALCGWFFQELKINKHVQIIDI